MIVGQTQRILVNNDINADQIRAINSGTVKEPSNELLSKKLATPSIDSLVTLSCSSVANIMNRRQSTDQKISVEIYKKENVSGKNPNNDKLLESREPQAFRIRVLPSIKDSTSATTSREAENIIDKFLTFIDKLRQQRTSVNVDSNYRLTNLLSLFIDEEARCETSTTTTASEVSQLKAYREKLEKANFVIPSAIILPPSQVVEVIMEYPPQKPLRTVIDECRPADANTGDTTETMRDRLAERSQFLGFPAPNLTRVLYEIGFGLATEAACRGLLSTVADKSNSGPTEEKKVDGRNLEQLRRLVDESRKQNHPHKLRLHRCSVEGCGYLCDTQIQMDLHKLCPHKKQHRWVCALCRQYAAYNERDIDEHYLRVHSVQADWGVPPAKTPCPLCDADFQFKWQLRTHFRTGDCPLYGRIAKINYGTEGQEVDLLNRYLWVKCGATGGADSGSVLSNRYPTSSVVLTPRRRVAEVVNAVASGKFISGPRPTARSVPPPLVAAPSPKLLAVTPSIRQRTPTFTAGAGQQQYLLQRGGTTAKVTTVPASLVQQLKLTKTEVFFCEICDAPCFPKLTYLKHLQTEHKKLPDKTEQDLMAEPPLACSRCKERFYSYEGLERHLLMQHGLVTMELLTKAQKRQDSGRCSLCNKVFSCSLLYHLVEEHKRTLCQAEIIYSCDVCQFQCKSYIQLEVHLRIHAKSTTPKNVNGSAPSTSTVNSTSTPASTSASNLIPSFLKANSTALNRVMQQTTLAGRLEKLEASKALLANTVGAKRPSELPALTHLAPPPKLFKYSSPNTGNRRSGDLAQATQLTNKFPLRIATLPTPSTTTAMMTMTTTTTSSNQPPPLKSAPVPSNPAPPSVQSAPESAPKPSSSVTKPTSTGNSDSRASRLLRYCCTPCNIKFVTYEAVLKHWTDRHLKKVLIPVCRIDDCTDCQEQLTSGSGKGSCANLRFDFTAPPSDLDSNLSRPSRNRSIGSHSSPSKELICLD